MAKRRTRRRVIGVVAMSAATIGAVISGVFVGGGDTQPDRRVVLINPGDPEMRSHYVDAVERSRVDAVEGVQVTAYRSEWYHVPSMIEPEELVVAEKTAIALEGYEDPKLVFYDYEPRAEEGAKPGSWNWYAQRNGPTADDIELCNYATNKTRERVHRDYPGVPVGLYGFPIAPHKGPYTDEELDRVDGVMSLVESADWLMVVLYSPSIPVDTDNEHEHRARIRSAMEETRKRAGGRPVYPILWFTNKQPIEPYARVYMDEIGELGWCDTVLVWAPVRDARETGRSISEWTQAAPYVRAWQRGE